MHTMQIIGWLFLVVTTIGLLIGAYVVAMLSRADDDIRKHLANNAWTEMVVFGVWIAGFAGSIGVLLGKPWGRAMLELFCWVMIILCLLTGAQKSLLAWRTHQRPALIGIALFIVPILLACGAAIVELRDASANNWFNQ